MTRSQIKIAFATAAAMTLAASSTVHAQAPEYAVVRIDQQLGTNSLTWGARISEDGDAVGYAFVNGNINAYVYTFEHGAVLLPMIGGMGTARAVDISDRDELGHVMIVGDAGFSSLDPSNPIGSQAVYWRYATTSDTITDSGVIGILPGSTYSLMRAVNNDGLAVGYSGGSATSPMVYDFDTGQLSAFVFPALPTDINNLGQVVGGTFVGDLNGGASDIGIPATTATASLVEITDGGMMAAGVRMPYTDGAGRFVSGAARYDGAWDLLWNNSAFDNASGANDGGDVVGLLGISAAIRPVLYWAQTDQLFLISGLATPTQPFICDGVADINDRQQIVTSIPAAVLTPLGSMVIPGDVNGDADVTLSDLCAFLSAPIDLDGDNDVDGDDEQWLLNRLAALQMVPTDCNGNGTPDTCDIESGVSGDCNADGVADDCQPDCDADGLPDDCESDCNANGNPDDCELAAGMASDCNFNGIPDECDGSESVTALKTYQPGQILIADDTFTDSLLIADVGMISDVDFTLNLDYRIGNIVVRLSHDGVTVTLIDQPGVPANPGGNGQLGYRITLDDHGTGPFIETVGNFGSPFEPIVSPPSYRPHEPLSAFDGLPRDGLWTIEVITIGPGAHFDPKINSWGVIVTDQAVPPGVCADIDDDGDLDTDDAAALVAVLMDAPQDPTHVARSDLNHDGATNGLDIQALVDALLE